MNRILIVDVPAVYAAMTLIKPIRDEVHRLRKEATDKIAAFEARAKELETRAQSRLILNEVSRNQAIEEYNLDAANTSKEVEALRVASDGLADKVNALGREVFDAVVAEIQPLIGEHVMMPLSSTLSCVCNDINSKAELNLLGGQGTWNITPVLIEALPEIEAKYSEEKVQEIAQ